MVIACVAVTSISGHLFAQEMITKQRTKSNNANERTADWDIKKNVKCRVMQTETGCTISFEHDVKSPRDAASGLATGKKGYDYYKAQSDFSVSAVDNSITEIKSPRDAASGLATGRRMHKPFTVTKELDKASPKLIETVAKGRSSGTVASEIAIDEPGVQNAVTNQDLSTAKATFKEFTVTKRCDGKVTKISCVDGECDIPIGDCPNGTCSITADWSWGLSQGGSSKRCSVDFLLEIEDGVCMAIKEQGVK